MAAFAEGEVHSRDQLPVSALHLAGHHVPEALPPPGEARRRTHQPHPPPSGQSRHSSHIYVHITDSHLAELVIILYIYIRAVNR